MEFDAVLSLFRGEAVLRYIQNKTAKKKKSNLYEFPNLQKPRSCFMYQILYHHRRDFNQQLVLSINC